MLRAWSLLGNSQRLDGGAMFGNAPRALWSRWAPPDAQGRIPLACRALLIETGGKRVLFETGIGSFFAPELRERYGVLEDEHVLLASLGAIGLSDADIDVIVLSHLHFDHAGGLLARFRPGVAASLLFPRARFVVGRAAYDRARHPHPRDRASFIPELPALLEHSGRLCLADDPEQARTLVAPQVYFKESFGHTVGMLHGWVRGARASLFFAADLVPGSAWVHLPISMGYDRYPEQLIDEKAAFFQELVGTQAHVFFTHDPELAAARLACSADGRYRSSAAVASFSAWDLDETAEPLPTGGER